MVDPTVPNGLRRAIMWVAFLNLGYFGIEFSIALIIHSVALFADSIDFLEDAFVNFLILIALSWSLRKRSYVGMILAAVLLIPSLATLWMAWEKLNAPLAPHALSLTLTGAGAFCVNLSCAFLLTAYREYRGSLTRAAFLSARNDVFANLAIMATGLVTAYIWHSGWPDLITGLGIAIMNAHAAVEVWQTAREEHHEAKA